MIKRILSGTAAVLAVFTSVAQPRQVMLDRVVAVVGNSSILHSEVEGAAAELVENRRQQGYTSDRDPRNEALEMLMEQKLLFHQGQIDSVFVNPAEISGRTEEHLRSLIEEAGGISELEHSQNMPVFNIREKIRKHYEEMAYADEMRRSVVSGIRITPGEVERFYKGIDKDSLPLIPEQYIYAQITRFPATMTEAKQRARERLLDIRQRIISGESRFEIMARMYSEDASAPRGGELDPAPLTAWTPSFSRALGELKPGQISEVIETEFGYHLIYLIDQKGSIYHARHIVLRPTYAEEELIAPARMLDSIARLIRQDSLTFEKAALDFSDDTNSKMNGGIVTNHDLLKYYGVQATTTRFKREDFGREALKSLEDYNALHNLKEGEVSGAFRTTDMIGNQLSKIVKLMRVIPPHTASLDEDYIDIERMTLSLKQQKTYREWLDEKIDGMYVYIVPEMRDGAFENKKWVK